MKRPSWTLTVVMVIGAAIFGIGFGHYQWFPYRPLRLVVAREWPRTTTEKYIRARTTFFRQMEGSADVVMLGDSLTESGGDWREFFPDFVVQNWGISGDTTEGVLGRLDEVIGRKPKVVAVLIGINDVRAGIDPAKIIFGIEEILRRIKASGTVPIMQSILLTNNEPDTNAAVARINTTIAAWCAEEKITFLNLNRVLAPFGILDQTTSTDGIHLNYTGYLRWSATLYPELRRALAAGG